MIHLEPQQLNHFFKKWHIKGIDQEVSINEFSEADKGDKWHSHPYDFSSTILYGGYREEILTPLEDGVAIHTVDRLPGETHVVKAGDIHRIVKLFGDKCLTFMVPHSGHIPEKETRFYKFQDDKLVWRMWNETEFKEFKL